MTRPRRDYSLSSKGICCVDIDTDAADVAYETDLTDVNTYADGDRDGDGKVTNKESLTKDEDHPLEYYLTCVEEVNKLDLIKEDYTPGSTLQLDRIEE
jgi:hypothetical protein